MIKQCLIASGFALCLFSTGRAETLQVRHRTCIDEISTSKPLCDPGEVDIVSRPFDLYAKARQIPVAASLAALPRTFTAYVYDFGDAPNTGWLTPPVLHIPQRYPETRARLGTINLTLHNLLPPLLDNTDMINGAIPAGEQPLNLHTHGLLVLPHAADANGAYGDYIGVLGCPASTKAACPHEPMDMQMSQVCGMAKSAADGHPCEMSGMAMGAGSQAHAGRASPIRIHGHDVLLKPVPYAIEVAGNHPASLDWFHPHSHELTSPQVGAGLSGAMTVGSFCSDPALADNARAALCTSRDGEAVPNDKLAIRMLLLKDLQVFDDRQGDKGDHPGPKMPSAEGYRVIPQCTDSGVLNDGYCPFKSGDASELPGHWLFTVNSQLRPVIAMSESKPELWRIANISSNASYRLSLCLDAPIADTAGDASLATCGQFKSFRIISLDGGRKPDAATLADETEAFLPPGARAEILILPKAGEHLTLIQKGFHQPDLYPPVVLATATTEPGTAPALPALTFKPNGPVKPGAPSVSFTEPDDCKQRPSGLGVNDWLSLAGKDEVVSVFFGKVSSDPEILTIGLVRGNPEESADTETRSHIDACLASGDAKSFDCKWFKGTPFTMEHRNLCLKHGTRVTFRLYNLTDETHNFHMHQQKFSVTVASAPEQPTPSAAATQESVAQRQLISKGPEGGAHGSVDSVPVPSAWIKDEKGQLTGRNPVEAVTMTFDGADQVGDFAFHCHILEHEDKGMMKRITVYTPTMH